MGERTEYKPGTFSWAELATTDPDGAKGFYGGLFGWEAQDMPAGESGVYTMCSLRGSYVGAVMEQGEQEREMGIPPHWNNYVTVDDVDASTARASELGATVAAGPFDVMEAGRMSAIQDPTGAFLCLWQPRDHIGASLVNEPGCLTWNDLNTPDPDTAREFYEALFGWTYEKMDSDEADYWITWNGERTNGGLMRMETEGAPSFWIPYFAVEDVEAATEKATSSGGGKHKGPITVPVGRFSILHDPAGAVFAVYEGK
ncbi:MAG TPA: VOC family protein, partial [Thermoleophilaceae bacterium]